MKQINFYMMMMMVLLILVMLMILLSVAFLTLLERKLLGSFHIRKGPNKVGIIGMLQPFSDAMKLLSKDFIYMYKFNYLLYMFFPLFMMILILMMWMVYPFFNNCMMMIWSLIYLMCCFSLGAYGLMLSGWSSNSMYSMLGSVRSLAQSISYEVSLSIMIIIPMFMIESLDFMKLINYDTGDSFMFMWPLSMIFLLSILAELNRSPFDFSEGESELVSGFNLEYGSSMFTLIFLSEYASILFLSLLFIMFFYSSNFYELWFFMKILIMVWFVIWVRASFPRFRYDLLMYMCWMMILPMTLNIKFLMVFFKVYLYN